MIKISNIFCFEFIRGSKNIIFIIGKFNDITFLMTFRQADNSEVRQADNSEIQDPGRPQKFRIPAEVRNRMNMITGTMYLIMIL